MQRFILFLLVLLAILLSACGGQQALAISDAWARPGIAGGNSAVYFVVTPGSDTDTLLSASSEIATMTELHRSEMGADGTMLMTPQENVPIPAEETVSFEPGGLHLMLIGLEGDLKAGDVFEVVLKFETAGNVNVKVTVRAP